MAASANAAAARRRGMAPDSARNLHGIPAPAPRGRGTLGSHGRERRHTRRRAWPPMTGVAPLICVIEDEEVIAAAVAARLRAEGFAVETAGDGAAGVELCVRIRHERRIHHP